jgi:hypothetical protein
MSNLKIEIVDIEELNTPAWRATYTLRPNLLILSALLTQYGFVQPIHVARQNSIIIDGTERVNLCRNVKALSGIKKNGIPVIFHDISEKQAMMMHLQMNRGNNNIVAKKMSSIIKKLYVSGSYTEKDFDDLLCMKRQEFELMIDGSILKSRKIQEHNYSRAWVPVEAPPGTIDNGPFIEKPPNQDR